MLKWYKGFYKYKILGVMKVMLNTEIYHGFGLSVMSEIPLREFIHLEHRDLVDVQVNIDDLSHLWDEYNQHENSFVVNENHIMFQVTGTAIYLIENGNKITVSPYEGADEDQIRLYLLGTCMGVILQQRKILPLHGSVIAINGKAYAFVGDSGAGKSTLASAFLKKGYQLLTDDVIPVRFTEDGVPMVIPSYPHQKLWQQSLNHFGMESDQYRPLFGRETKFAVPVSSQFSQEALPLGGIFELIKSEDEEIEVRPIQGLERLHALYKHTYRNFLLAPAGLMDWHFATSTQLINQTDLYQLRRPVSRFTANDLTEVILETLQKGEARSESPVS
jgi:hypothetical protein